MPALNSPNDEHWQAPIKSHMQSHNQDEGRCKNRKSQHTPSTLLYHPSVPLPQILLQQAEKDKWQSKFLQSISELLHSWELYTTPMYWQSS